MTARAYPRVQDRSGAPGQVPECSITRAARDLDIHVNTLLKWIEDYAQAPIHAFPGEGKLIRAG